MRDYDPEIEADRRRRESAPTAPAIDELQHNDPQLRRLLALYDRKPEPIAAHWPCRICRAPVAMTAGAIATVRDRMNAYNRVLSTRRERPITSDEIMICRSCRDQQPQPKEAT
jgi:hypothetical protein